MTRLTQMEENLMKTVAAGPTGRRVKAIAPERGAVGGRADKIELRPGRIA